MQLIRLQHLDRDVAAELRIAGAEHLAYPTSTDGRDNSYGPSRVPEMRSIAAEGDLFHLAQS